MQKIPIHPLACQDNGDLIIPRVNAPVITDPNSNETTLTIGGTGWSGFWLKIKDRQGTQTILSTFTTPASGETSGFTEHTGSGENYASVFIDNTDLPSELNEYWYVLGYTQDSQDIPFLEGPLERYG